jgi:class 3 adenylate cyclase
MNQKTENDGQEEPLSSTPMPKPETEKAQQAYQRFLQELMISRLRFGALLGMILCPLILLFAAIVGGLNVDAFVIFMFVLYIAIFAMELWFRSYSDWVYHHSFMITMISNMIFAASLILVLIHMEIPLTAPNHSFALGMCIIGVVIMYPFHVYQHAFFCVYCLAAYLAPLFLGEEPPVWNAHMYNIHAIVFFSLIVLFESYLSNQLRRRDFFSQLAQKELNEELDREQQAMKILNKELDREREKSEQLLLNMLPAAISERLKQEQKRIADKYAEATVLFADLVGFTELSSSMLPSNIVGIIDDIFSRFDSIMEKHGLEKIKTIGDAYMAVGGVPIENDHHAQSVIEAALEMRNAINDFNKETGESLDLRIGIHSGPLVAGVIGRKKMSYDIWGDTVNIASRMESHSENGKIQFSETTYHFIKGKFQIEKRGEINIKGKGMMKTYYLLDKVD